MHLAPTPCTIFCVAMGAVSPQKQTLGATPALPATVFPTSANDRVLRAWAPVLNKGGSKQ